MKKVFLVLILALVSITAQSAEYKLRWDAVTGANGYTVYYSDTNGNQYNKSVPTTEIPLADLNLAPGIEYTFSLTAFNTTCESERSESISHLIPFYTPPDANLPKKTVVVSAPAGVNVLVVGE